MKRCAILKQPRRKLEMPHQFETNARVTLFPNVKKEAGSKQPDYTGFVSILTDLKAGTELRLACWKGESKNGNKMLSGHASPRDAKPNANANGASEPVRSPTVKQSRKTDDMLPEW